MKFKLVSQFKPTGDQPLAIEKLINGINKGYPDQVLLGVTGSGKTFTLANVIKEIQKPTLVISHNKTLAAQLYQEFRDFFPQNAVSYFVSYYDYYQPEAYIPRSDTYIEKEAQINDLIDQLRLSATANLLTRQDTIIVASVSCIYNLGSPKEYRNFVLILKNKQIINRREILLQLSKLQYQRSPYDFKRGTYRLIGEALDIFPAYEDFAYRITLDENLIKNIRILDPLTGNAGIPTNQIFIYPAKHYMTNPEVMDRAFKEINHDLSMQIKKLRQQKKYLEAQRLQSRVSYDLEMIKEMGFVNGIENYSRYFDGRNPGDPPFTLLDYFKEPYGYDWLCIVDESHMTIPQINGMYNGDRSRKETLINYGFRLPSALDNRPLKFVEFLQRVPQMICVSATPGEWEMSRAKENSRQKAESSKEQINGNGIVEQLIRPTGLVDPKIIIKPIKGQIEDLIKEIKKRVAIGERVLVTTLTKRMAEDLSEYLNESQKSIVISSESEGRVEKSSVSVERSLHSLGPSTSFTLSAVNVLGMTREAIKVAYLHSDVETLDRQDILDSLRKGDFDVLIGINLLREGLDLPEVSLVAIMDADKEGFLRSDTSLIQTMGRAARHINGQVIMYADSITGSMRRAIDEVNRRRQIQINYNKKHHIFPKSIKKPIRDKLVEREASEGSTLPCKVEPYKIKIDDLTPEDKKKLVVKLKTAMRQAAHDLDFEMAAKLRDKIKEVSRV